MADLLNTISKVTKKTNGYADVRDFPENPDDTTPYILNIFVVETAEVSLIIFDVSKRISTFLAFAIQKYYKIIGTFFERVLLVQYEILKRRLVFQKKKLPRLPSCRYLQSRKNYDSQLH